MKCEKCNNNEVSFIYESNINGKKTSKHLCSECAKAEGLDKAFISNRGDIFGDFFGESESLFSPLFSSPRRSLLSAFGMPSGVKSLLAPAFPRFFYVDNNSNCSETESSCGCEQSGGCAETEKSGEAPMDDIGRQRKLEALRYELGEAVKAENFEKAILLRDEIKKIEGR